MTTMRIAGNDDPKPANNHHHFRPVDGGRTGPVRGSTAPIDQSPRRRWMSVGAAMLLIVTLSGIDVIPIKSTFDIVLGQSEIFSWILAILVALGAAVLMWTSGALTASLRIDPDPVRRVSAVSSGMVWLAVGVGLLYLRWNASDYETTPVFTEGQAVETAGSDPHHLIAVLMFVMFLLPGCLAFIDGFKFSHPVAAHQRRSSAARQAWHERLVNLEGETSRVRSLLQYHQRELEDAVTHTEQAKRANAAFATELRAFVRAEIARRIGDPSAAGMTDPEESMPKQR